MPDPQQLADLPFAAFLIIAGLALFGLLARGVLRWGREVERAEKGEGEWRAIATQATATATQQSQQIKQLTEMVERLTERKGAA